MRFEAQQISLRLPVWKALSEMFLDTELSEDDQKSIAAQILASEFTPKEIEDILWTEVFPSVGSNLQGIAGEWAGFDERWLIDQIEEVVSKGITKIPFLGLLLAPQVKKSVAAEWTEVCAHLPSEYGPKNV